MSSCDHINESSNTESVDSGMQNSPEDSNVPEEVLSPEEHEKRVKEATDLKNQGNSFFKDKAYQDALQCYKNALEVCPIQNASDLRVILYSNLAAASDHLDLHDDAIGYCNEALALNPQHTKALFRRAQLYQKTDKLDEALADYQEYLKLVPDDKSTRREVAELEVRINERNEKLKKEMLGKLKDLGNMILKPFGLSTDNFQMVKNPETGNYSVNFTNQRQ